ncbi:hypothetical protein D9758_010691 [Tetrapyrgos nigripes]|uniref:ATP-dependent DNA helicase II subunit 1 n=1 Tax=Tetrapyrgos nigripes TaxID=182062 RepID=A0A8H5GG71_9AGAR|nr:hypothetical protein D9758_010691 [Tetrapyrgos nigripes]
MAPYDDWNRVEDEDDEELQDASSFEAKKDVILFCIDCCPSMLELREDPDDEDAPKKCHLYAALDAAMQIQKKKIITGPNDSAGILLYNTTKSSENKKGQGSEIKPNLYLYQPIGPLDVAKIQDIRALLDAAKEDPEELRRMFPPLEDKRVPMGDVFTSCNWVIRDGAPKTASKRVFLISNQDQPHLTNSQQLITSARTTLTDLMQAGVTVEPFFINAEEEQFDLNKFYSHVLMQNAFAEDEDEEKDPSVLPESISIARIGDLLSQMRFHEVPKRAQFSIPFELGAGLTIGVKGYGLVTEQKKGGYKYFTDLGDRIEAVVSKTVYLDQELEGEMDRSNVFYGMSVGSQEEKTEDITGSVRPVLAGQRPFYTADEVRSFRTLGLEPGIKLLGFKDRSTLAFEDNVKHSLFIYPDELSYSGSKRTFTALLKTLIKQDKIALVLALTRRNSSPLFCALLPQEEKADDAGWMEPSGFHLITLPFADDIRAATVQEGYRAPTSLEEAAYAWITKLSLKGSGYQPDSYPNPALAYHNAQLEASAFQEEFDEEDFEDLTEPNVDMIHKRAGKLMKDWKLALLDDESSNMVSVVSAGSKRKADVSVDETEIRSRHEAGTLAKYTNEQLKAFLKSKGLSVSGKKADLLARIGDWLDDH